MNHQSDKQIHKSSLQTKELLSLWSWGPTQWHMGVFWFSNLEVLQTHIWVFMKACFIT